MRTKGFCRTGAALAGALMLAAGASAKDDKPAEPEVIEEVTVTGKVEQPPAAVRQQARSITAQTGAVYHTPLAMFQDAVCPGIAGLPRAIAEVMVDRIRYNAERVGLRTAGGEKCQPNIFVGFIVNGQQTIKALAKKQPYIFKNISYDELKGLIADKGPVHAWVNTIVKSRQGDVLSGDNSADLTQIPVLNVGQSQSHIFLAHRLDITNSVILLDLPAVDGMTAVQLADYVTMRMFARTKPVEGDAAVGTILSLFDKGASRPAELTDFDLAYLRSIYSGIPNLNAASKLAGINRQLTQVQKERASADGGPE